MRILDTKSLSWALFISLFLIISYLKVRKKEIQRYRSELIQIGQKNPARKEISQGLLMKNLIRNPYCGQKGKYFYYLRFFPNKTVHIWLSPEKMKESPKTLPNFISSYTIKENQLSFSHSLFGPQVIFTYNAQNIPNSDFHFLTLRNQNSLLSPRICETLASP